MVQNRCCFTIKRIPSCLLDDNAGTRSSVCTPAAATIGEIMHPEVLTTSNEANKSLFVRGVLEKNLIDTFGIEHFGKVVAYIENNPSRRRL